jgi:hypothetical protein
MPLFVGKTMVLTWEVELFEDQHGRGCLCENARPNRHDNEKNFVLENKDFDSSNNDFGFRNIWALSLCSIKNKGESYSWGFSFKDTGLSGQRHNRSWRDEWNLVTAFELLEQQFTISHYMLYNENSMELLQWKARWVLCCSSLPFTWMERWFKEHVRGKEDGRRWKTRPDEQVPYLRCCWASLIDVQRVELSTRDTDCSNKCSWTRASWSYSRVKRILSSQINFYDELWQSVCVPMEDSLRESWYKEISWRIFIKRVLREKRRLLPLPAKGFFYMWLWHQMKSYAKPYPNDEETFC